MPRRLLTAILALGLLACGEAGGAPDAGPSTMVDPALEIGTGEGRFTSFEDGDTLGLNPGCQGSQHVWIALRATGIDERGPIIDLELARADDGVVVSQTFRVRVSFEAVPGTEYADIYGLTLLVPDPDMALGQDLIVRATVTDMNGVVVTDERPIRIDWVEGPCSGPGG